MSDPEQKPLMEESQYSGGSNDSDKSVERPSKCCCCCGIDAGCKLISAINLDFVFTLAVYTTGMYHEPSNQWWYVTINLVIILGFGIPAWVGAFKYQCESPEKKKTIAMLTKSTGWLIWLIVTLTIWQIIYCEYWAEDHLVLGWAVEGQKADENDTLVSDGVNQEYKIARRNFVMANIANGVFWALWFIYFQSISDARYAEKRKELEAAKANN